MALSIHPKSKSFTPMWTVLGFHKVFAKKVLHKAVHAALSDSKQNMGKLHSKDTQTAKETDNDDLRIDLLHLPTAAVTGSTAFFNCGEATQFYNSIFFSTLSPRRSS